jgi:DNA modification methylase
MPRNTGDSASPSEKPVAPGGQLAVPPLPFKRRGFPRGFADHVFYQGDCRHLLAQLPAASVHCCISSPPYWGLRDYGLGAEALGLEPQPDCRGWATGAACGACYVCHMVEVFRAVRRVLRDDGTLWLNLGDSYTSGGRADFGPPTSTKSNVCKATPRAPQPPGLQPKDLCGLPWRVALALQADGWLLRSDIIWHKPNPMPESVRDRPTKAHEYVFLLAKRQRYSYDAEAVKETSAALSGWDRQRRAGVDTWTYGRTAGGNTSNGVGGTLSRGSRNRRSVWTLPTHPLKAAHFATFPPRLVEPCLLAGTSEAGACAACGQPWVRVVERAFVKLANRLPTRKALLPGADMADINSHNAMGYNRVTTLGFRPACRCEADPVPCTVLDPFAGAGTVALVAAQHGRRSIGMELNPDYIALARARLAEVA